MTFIEQRAHSYDMCILHVHAVAYNIHILLCYTYVNYVHNLISIFKCHKYVCEIEKEFERSSNKHFEVWYHFLN